MLLAVNYPSQLLQQLASDLVLGCVTVTW